MPYYVLERARVDGGGYAAPLGSLRSYVKLLAQARRFATLADAERNRCGNERIVEISTSNAALGT